MATSRTVGCPTVKIQGFNLDVVDDILINRFFTIMLTKFCWLLSFGMATTLLGDSLLSTAAAVEENAALDPVQIASAPSQVIEVNGQGNATITADQARVTLVFLTSDLDELFAELMETYEEAVASGEITSILGSINLSIDDLEEITEADLQLVIEALTASGIDREALEINLEHDVWAAGPVANIKGASVSFQLQKPTVETLEKLSDSIDAAIAHEPDIFLVERRAQYSTEQCELLERDAYESAVTDARKRADVIAEALGVELEEVPSVAEPSSDYGYYQPQCEVGEVADPGAIGGYSYDLFELQAFSPPEISLTRALRVTYSVR
ncbi:MAG: SIMPL domain-containing protein [Cyanobacteria bacterium P01_A01_bin.114]